MFVDTHAHLFYPNFNGEVDAVLERAKNAGVNYILVPGTDLASSSQAVEMAQKYNSVFAAVGVHPHDSKDWDDILLKNIEDLSKNEKVVAIGEIGLDYYYDFSPKAKQIEAFEAQIELALSLNRPIIVHNREANDDIMTIIRRFTGTNLRAQFHCFAGSLEDAKELIQLNHMISFPGNVTFKRADNLRSLISALSIDNLLLETDSPFMTPVPHRGQRNEPSYLPLIANQFSSIFNISMDDVARTTSLNAFRLFGIGKKPGVNYTYKIHNSLYINITNRCNAGCIFCGREKEPFIHGYNLGMSKSAEPDAATYVNEIGDPKQYDEIVFCGYGEPTIRWNIVKEVALHVKKNGGKTRLNTNGHGNKINQKDITLDFPGLIDVVSVSLNTTDRVKYSKIMGVNQEMFDEMTDFIQKAKTLTRVIATIVNFDDIDVAKAKQFTEQVLGIEFRERRYF